MDDIQGAVDRADVAPLRPLYGSSIADFHRSTPEEIIGTLPKMPDSPFCENNATPGAARSAYFPAHSMGSPGVSCSNIIPRMGRRIDTVIIVGAVVVVVEIKVGAQRLIVLRSSRCGITLSTSRISTPPANRWQLCRCWLQQRLNLSRHWNSKLTKTMSFGRSRSAAMAFVRQLKWDFAKSPGPQWTRRNGFAPPIVRCQPSSKLLGSFTLNIQWKQLRGMTPELTTCASHRTKSMRSSTRPWLSAKRLFVSSQAYQARVRRWWA